VLGDVCGSKLSRDAEAHDACNVLGPCPPAALLSTSLEERLDGYAFAENKGADAFGASDLVRGEAQHVGVKRANIERHASRRLNCVAVQQSAGLMNDLCRLGGRLDRACLGVFLHHGAE